MSIRVNYAKSVHGRKEINEIIKVIKLGYKMNRLKANATCNHIDRIIRTLTQLFL